jgi:predicted nucleic acid-binding protein
MPGLPSSPHVSWGGKDTSRRILNLSGPFHRLHGFSFWDALVLRAAKQAGCSVLFSENFQDAREIDGVRIVNPFR